MQGEIHQVTNKLSYFMKGKSEKLIVLIGGLTDTLFSVKYFEYLWTHFEGCTLCLPIMRSSGGGFGGVTIWDDVEDLKNILKDITTKNTIKDIYLIGHSTGCQDILCLFKQHVNKEFPIRKCVIYV